MRLKLSPYHPFTEKQKTVVEGIIGGRSTKDITRRNRFGRSTVKNCLSGSETNSGIYGTIYKHTGKRPDSRANLLMILAEQDLLVGRKNKKRKKK